MPENRAEAVAQNHPPSTEAEKRLAAMWQQVLNVPVTGVKDDFFHLGGDSLSGTQLVMLIRQEFGKELSLMTLLKHPTIQRLGWLLSDAPVNAAVTQGPVVAMRRQGSRPPWFCISSALTDVNCFRNIAKYLSPDQPVFALGNPMHGEGLQTVEELAERARKLIQEVRPAGPYFLGGYCFGGLVAYETACQLIADGEDVRLVVLFDTVTPGYPKLLRNHQGYFRYLRQLAAFSKSGTHRIGLADIGRHLQYLGRLVRKKAVVQTQRAAVQMTPELVAPPAADPATFVETSARIYRPRPIAASVAHFIAEQEAVSTRIIEDPRLGWRDFCLADFRAHHVSALHATLFLEEQAEKIAKLLQVELLRHAPAV